MVIALKVMQCWLVVSDLDYPPLDAVKLPNDRLFRWAVITKRILRTAKRLQFLNLIVSGTYFEWQF